MNCWQVLMTIYNGTQLGDVAVSRQYTFINNKCLIMARNNNKPQNPALRKTAVVRSLRDCKEEWASKYDKTWEDVKRDFEYGLGLSKMYDFEQIMDMVAELYRKQ